MPHAEHNNYQRRYYSRPERKPRMWPTRSRYVQRHLDATLRAAGLPSEGCGRILELGCGMGRFTHLLLERGFDVTAVDLSPDLLHVLRDNLGQDVAGRLTTICCDAAEVHRMVKPPFDAAIGFFFLHHLQILAPTFRSVARVLAADGRLAFCEPNAFNPLYYLQILGTPGMTWAAEKGVARMRPGVLRRELLQAGLSEPRIDRYGMFPPAVSNHRAGASAEAWIERLRWLEPVLAFQVASATVCT